MRVRDDGRKKEIEYQSKLSKEDVNEKSEYKGGRRIHSYEELEKREFNEYYAQGNDEDENSENEEKFDSVKYLENAEIEGETVKEREARLRRIYDAQRAAEKERKTKSRTNKLNMTFGRVARIVLVSAMTIGVTILGVRYEYLKEIKHPKEYKLEDKYTGRKAIEDWQMNLSKFLVSGKDEDDKKVSGMLEKLPTSSGEDSVSYLNMEKTYANSDEYKMKFFDEIIKTIEYTPSEVQAYDVYGNLLLNDNGNVVYRVSDVTDDDEEVVLSYVDYSAIEIDSKKVKSMMEKEGLKLGDPGYSSKLTNIFCKYMVDLGLENLPRKSEKHIVSMVKGQTGDGLHNIYAVSQEEDIFLDKLLFSSNDFYKLLERFSLTAAGGSVNPEWALWNELSDEEKEKTKEPEKVLSSLSVSQDWLDWLNSEDKEDEKEPDKYNADYVISKTWCGAYYLQNEYMTVDENGNLVRNAVGAQLGDGTFEDPASLNTEVLTVVRGNVKVDDKIQVKEYPISVKMVEYGVSEDAIKWFESKDERNRGKDVQSEIQYVYYIFEVKNLSDKTIRISDNSSLSDENVNLTKRTGKIYGITDSVILKPNEVGRIESWSCSVDLNKKYIIWGADFKREKDVVWFRKLAGDLEDTSEEKGVTLNRSRYKTPGSDAD